MRFMPFKLIFQKKQLTRIWLIVFTSNVHYTSDLLQIMQFLNFSQFSNASKTKQYIFKFFLHCFHSPNFTFSIPIFFLTHDLIKHSYFQYNVIQQTITMPTSAIEQRPPTKVNFRTSPKGFLNALSVSGFADNRIPFNRYFLAFG